MRIQTIFRSKGEIAQNQRELGDFVEDAICYEEMQIQQKLLDIAESRERVVLLKEIAQLTKREGELGAGIPEKLVAAVETLIVQERYRPVWVVQQTKNGGYALDRMGNTPITYQGTRRWQEFVAQKQIKQGESVGRVEAGIHCDLPQYLGTAFLISARVALTNAHVLGCRDICWLQADGTVGQKARVMLSIEFGAVKEATLPAKAFAIDQVRYLAADGQYDLAVIELEENVPIKPLSLQLEPIPKEYLAGRLVCLIAHHDPWSTDWEVWPGTSVSKEPWKKVMPGRLDLQRPLDQYNGRAVLCHDCTTIGGASGGPLIDLGPLEGKDPHPQSVGKVIGIQMRSCDGIQNQAIPMWEIKEIIEKYCRKE